MNCGLMNFMVFFDFFRYFTVCQSVALETMCTSFLQMEIELNSKNPEMIL